MRAKLTKKAVEAVKPGERDIILSDTELTGFGCKITPKGKRTYFVYYRTRGGQQRRPTIGVHGAVTCEQARKDAQQILAAVARGGDPSAKRKAERMAGTVGELCDRFIDEFLPLKRETTAREYRRLIERHIRPALGKMKAKDVTVADVARLHHKMRKTPRSANQAVSILSRMMKQAVRWQMRRDNPCRGAVDRFPENERERFLTELELSRLGAVLNDAERTRTELQGVIRAIRLLAFTGRRMGDVLSLRWEHVDFEKGCLRLPNTKTGSQEVTLGAPALALLAGMERTGEYVVHGPDPDKPLSVGTLESAWHRIRQRASIPDVRIHDLRHTVGTYAAQAGANAFLVRDKLGHKTLAMTGRYVERDVEPLRVLTDKVETRIAAAMSGNGEEAEVVELPGGKQ